MTPEETGDDIAHHVGIAGRSEPLFSDDAVELTHHVGRGLPRPVDDLAVRSSSPPEPAGARSSTPPPAPSLPTSPAANLPG